MMTTQSQTNPSGQRTAANRLGAISLRGLLMAGLFTASLIALRTTAGTVYCSDSISTNNTSSLSPLQEQAANWSYENNELECGPHANFSYGRICLYSNLTDCTVEGIIKFGPNGYGGGLGGRLNPQTGEHYAVWVYPHYTFGTGNLLRITKFTSWNSWTLLAQTNVDLTSSNAHSLKVSFVGSNITATFDGVDVAHASDSAYTSGGIVTEMWTDWNQYEFSVAHLTLSTPILPPAQTPTPVIITALAPQPGGAMQITAKGDIAATYVLQATDEFNTATWLNIATNNASEAGVVQFADLDAPNHTQRFYRILTP